MKIGIPRERAAQERRVAASPDTVAKLVGRGHEVLVEAGAGVTAELSDAMFEAAGATMVSTARELYAASEVILKINPPMEVEGEHEADWLNEGATLLSFIWPAEAKELLERLSARKVNVFAMDAVPRITRAQKMDALSSMANIAGYRAVVEAANAYGGFFSGQITAAGRIPPAHVLIIGAGVAGLAAIGAARGLGAVVRAFDTREAVREQVQSLGAMFVEFHFDESGEGEGGYAKQMSDAYLEAEQTLLARHASEVDIVITTALIPGRPAPVLVTEDAVKGMKPGSVIVDLAAARGGNCPLVVADEVTEAHGVKIIGYTDLPSRMPRQSSLLYATNIYNLLDELIGPDEAFNFDLENEVIRGAIILEKGELRWPPPKVKPASAPAASAEKKAPSKEPVAKAAAPKAPAASAPPTKAARPSGHGHGASTSSGSTQTTAVVVGILVVVLVALGIVAPTEFLRHLTVFLLACIVGWHVIWNVTAALHTPLMSVTNAISGIILIGGMLMVKTGEWTAASILGMVAILVAAINVAGGFLVTQRMLRMFRK